MRQTLSKLRLSTQAMVTRKTNRFAALGFVLVLCSAGIVFGFRAYNVARAESASSPHTNPPASTLLPAVMQAGLPSRFGPFQVVQFTLYDVGIYPREVHIAKGLIALSIEDLSGGISSLAIEQNIGSAPVQLGRVERATNSLRGRGVIDLGPGKYEVYIAERPNSRASLIVE